MYAPSSCPLLLLQHYNVTIKEKKTNKEDIVAALAQHISAGYIAGSLPSPPPAGTAADLKQKQRKGASTSTAEKNAKKTKQASGASRAPTGTQYHGGAAAKKKRSKSNIKKPRAMDPTYYDGVHYHPNQTTRCKECCPPEMCESCGGSGLARCGNCGGVGCEKCSPPCWGKECYFISHEKYVSEADAGLPENNPEWEEWN